MCKIQVKGSDRGHTDPIPDTRGGFPLSHRIERPAHSKSPATHPTQDDTRRRQHAAATPRSPRDGSAQPALPGSGAGADLRRAPRRQDPGHGPGRHRSGGGALRHVWRARRAGRTRADRRAVADPLRPGLPLRPGHARPELHGLGPAPAPVAHGEPGDPGRPGGGGDDRPGRPGRGRGLLRGADPDGALRLHRGPAALGGREPDGRRDRARLRGGRVSLAAGRAADQQQLLPAHRRDHRVHRLLGAGALPPPGLPAAP